MPVDCPTDDELYRLGSEEQDASPSVAAHVDGCAECQAKLDRLRAEVTTARLLYAGAAADGPLPLGDGDDGQPAFLGKYFLAGTVDEDERWIHYRGVHAALNAEVLVHKSKASSGDASWAEALLAHARRYAVLQNPRVARVLDVELIDGAACFVTEYVAGQAIDVYCRENDCSPSNVAAMIASAAEAVAAASALGLEHGSITPRSVRVDEAGDVRITGYGLAAGERDRSTGPGTGNDVAALANLLRTLLGPRITPALEQACRECAEASPADANAHVARARLFAERLSRAAGRRFPVGVVTMAAAVAIAAIAAWLLWH